MLLGGQRNLGFLGLPWALEDQEFQGSQGLQGRLDPRMAPGDLGAPGGLGGLVLHLGLVARGHQAVLL